MDRGAWWATGPRGHQESNVTEQPSMQTHIKLWIPTVDSNERHISETTPDGKKHQGCHNIREAPPPLKTGLPGTRTVSLQSSKS